MLKLRHLNKNFGGIKAVNNCSLEIKENSITALIGPNGSGKTTLFNLISGILKKDNGEIYFNNQDITNQQIYEISNLGVSKLFQQSKLFDNFSVRENLELALNKEDTRFLKSLTNSKISKENSKKIQEISKLMNINLFMEKQTKNLSYGQKRLVEIARTILNPHKILLLDEPVAGVNPKLKKEIIKIILNLKKQGETILFIEHDLNFTLSIADNIIVMDKGEIIAQGNPSKIKNNPKVIETYLGE